MAKVKHVLSAVFSNCIAVLSLSIAGIAILIGLLFVPSKTFAGTYEGWHTGYAFGALYGSSGWVVQQTDFANHSPYYCPNDPAAYWSFGTVVTEDSPITFHTSTGNTYNWSDLTLTDIGDISCSQGNYWVDVYFGRYKPDQDPCDCNNAEEHCYSGAVNCCADAINFGRQWRSYS